MHRPARIELNKRSWKSRQPRAWKKLLFFEAIVSRLPRRGSSTILTRTSLINLVGENFSLAGTNCGLTNRGHADPRLFPSRIPPGRGGSKQFEFSAFPPRFLHDFIHISFFRIGRIMDKVLMHRKGNFIKSCEFLILLRL